MISDKERKAAMQNAQRDQQGERFYERQINAGGGGEILTVRMVSDYLHCHPSTIYRLIKHRAIPAFKIGADWRFHRAALERWLNAKIEAADRN